MKDRFSGTPLLRALLTIAIISLVGIGALFALDLSARLETVLYYVFFAFLFVAAVLYNVVSLQKGRWLAGELKRKLKTPK